MTTVNPYTTNIQNLSLRLAHFNDSDSEFRFKFDVKNLSLEHEPMYKWFIATKKLIVGIKNDPNRSFIKNQRAQPGWISECFPYWTSYERYFLIGFALDYCRVNSTNATIDIERLANYFEDEAEHDYLLESFVEQVFYADGVDTFGKRIVTNQNLEALQIAARHLKRGYRFCVDLFLAMDVLSRTGSTLEYKAVEDVCKSLGLTELPCWFLLPYTNHPLNKDLRIDIEQQKTEALWAAQAINGVLYMVSSINPYNISASNMQNLQVSVPLTPSRPVRRKSRRKVRTKSVKNENKAAIPTPNKTTSVDAQMDQAIQKTSIASAQNKELSQPKVSQKPKQSQSLNANIVEQNHSDNVSSDNLDDMFDFEFEDTIEIKDDIEVEETVIKEKKKMSAASLKILNQFAT